MCGAFYTSSEFLQLEEDELFRREWICVGHEREIPRPGDYFTTDLVDEPLIVVRADDGAVRVLSNVCRHRGNVVARGSGNARRFTCGYHSWSYATDGKLIGAPRMEGLDKSNCRLPNFSVERWRGFIFVNLEGKAQPLASALRDLEPLVEHYEPEQQQLLYKTDEIWATNWKCLVENFMEGYHLSSIHPKTLHPYTPTALCEKLPNGAAFTGYRSHMDPSCPDFAPPYQANLNAVERRSSVLYCIYPSFVVAFGPATAMTSYMCIRPLGVGSVGIRLGIIGPTCDPDVLSEIVRVTEEFCGEDRAALEGLYKGLKSRYYKSGPLAGAHFEGTIWDILQYMAERLGSQR
jgi:phenylpropionate dioxygenase-like ring-hydroxylating dioxygenase large terminal subunit